MFSVVIGNPGTSISLKMAAAKLLVGDAITGLVDHGNHAFLLSSLARQVPSPRLDFIIDAI